MNLVELQQLKIKAMQATSGSQFTFPSDTPIDQVAAIISFLKESMIVLKNEYPNHLIRTIIQNTEYPNQLYLEAGLSQHQIQLVTEYANIDHHLWIDNATPVSNIQLITKYLKPYSAILKTNSNFPLMSLLALQTSLKPGCFFGLPYDAKPEQIRSILSFVNQGVILALPSQFSLDLMGVVKRFASFETCFFIGRDFNEKHYEIILNISKGHYCMFHPKLAKDFIKQLASLISPEAGIRMHKSHDLAEYIEILPYLSARAVVYLEHDWKEGHLGGILQSISERVAIRLHSGFSAAVALFVIKTTPVGCIIYLPYDIKEIMLEYLIGHFQAHTIICMGPQFEYACERFLNSLKNMKQGWWMPDPGMIEGCARYLARNLPEDFKIMLHPNMNASTALVFASELKNSIEFNIYPETSPDLLRFFMCGIETNFMYSSEVDTNLAKDSIVFLNKSASFMPNPAMEMSLSYELISNLNQFSHVRLPKDIGFAIQLEFIKKLPNHSILYLDDSLSKVDVENIVKVLPETVGVKISKKFSLTSATYLARYLGVNNIVYLPHNIESLVADLIVLSLKEGATICLGSHYDSEDDLMIQLMARNKFAWIMPDPKMPYSRLRYLLNHAPENLKLMLHPQTDLRLAQIIGKEINQTIELNIHPQSPESLTQNFLLSYKGKIIMDGLADKSMLEVLRCGHELQLLQLPKHLVEEQFAQIVESLPPTGILHFQVQDLPKALLTKQLVAQFKADHVLSLADDVPIDLFEHIISALPDNAYLYMTGNCRVEKLHLAFRVLQAGTVIFLSPDIKEMAALAIIEKMGTRQDIFLMFHPLMPHTLLTKLLASLYPNTKVMLHPNSSEVFLQCFRNSWNSNCILTKHYLMPFDICNLFLSQFDKPIQLLMHPKTELSCVSELGSLINPNIFHPKKIS